MKVSKKARYGLRALVDLAVHIQECPVPLVEIAKRQEMSLNYLEQVLGALRKAGIVKSMKGPKGGYSLDKEPKEITVEEIFDAVEGKFCIVEKKEEKELDALQRAIRKLVWDQIDEDVIALLQDMTLAEIADKASESEKKLKTESGVDANREM
ncbi:RrF2 family transcriptional regulator [Coprococcus catus]